MEPTARRPPRLVRPYVVTQGRTAPGQHVALDATIEARRMPEELDRTAAPEARRMLTLCRKPVALAELAARLSLPVGVVRVLVDDLRATGAVAIVDAPEPDAATDVRLLERLLDGIRAL